MADIQHDEKELYRRNIGDDMTGSSQYYIVEDNVMLRQGQFQLNSMEELILFETANGSTFRFAADQCPGHPGFSNPALMIEGCGTNLSGSFSVKPTYTIPT